MLCGFCLSNSHTKSKWVVEAKKKQEAVVSLVIVSLLINMYIIFLDIFAAVFSSKLKFDDNLKNFYDIDTLKFQNNASIWTALIFDTVCIIFLIVIVLITCCVRSNSFVPVILSSTVLCPLFCIVAHSPYIIVAYLNDGSHASSIFIYYSVMIYVFFGVTWLFVHWYRHVNTIPRAMPGTDNYFELSEGGEIRSNDLGDGQTSNRNGGKKKCCISFLLLSTILLLLGLVALITSYLILIPINKAISDAPNRILSIYQSGGFLIGSFIVYKVIDYFYNKKKEEEYEKEKKKEIVYDILKDFYDEMKKDHKEKKTSVSAL